jgi:hypothetical protein
LALTIGRFDGEALTRRRARLAADGRETTEASVQVDDARTEACIVACDGEVLTCGVDGTFRSVFRRGLGHRVIHPVIGSSLIVSLYDI